MTNFEKFKDKILELIDDDEFSSHRVAVDLTTGEPKECDKFDCNRCLFQNSNCNQRLIKWLYEECKTIIKPCPFCGKTDTIKIKKEGDQYIILCNVHKGGCGGSSGYYYFQEEAIEKWNQRV